MITTELSVTAIDPTDPFSWSDQTEWVATDLRDPYGFGWKTDIGYTRNGSVHVLIDGREHVRSIEDVRLLAAALNALADRAEAVYVGARREAA